MTDGGLYWAVFETHADNTFIQKPMAGKQKNNSRGKISSKKQKSNKTYYSYILLKDACQESALLTNAIFYLAMICQKLDSSFTVKTNYAKLLTLCH